MSLTLQEVALMPDWEARFGRKDAWHGDTHKEDGSVIAESVGKPRVMFAQWSPPAMLADDPVEELHITYTDGQVVKVPASEFAVSAP